MDGVPDLDVRVRHLPRAHAYFCLFSGLVSLALICLVWLPCALLLHALLPVKRARRIGRRGATLIFRGYLWFLSALGACRFDLAALDSLRDDGPLILAPNHPSLLDALMIISRLPDVVCVMKAGLMRNILLGAGARLAGYIPNDQPRAMLRAACANLHAGSQLLLFPEGTRTACPPIDPIPRTTSSIARRAQAPVQVLLIETDSAFLTKGWPLLRCPNMPIHYRVRLGRRFDPPTNSRESSRPLEDYFRAILAGTHWSPPFAEAH